MPSLKSISAGTAAAVGVPSAIGYLVPGVQEQLTAWVIVESKDRGLNLAAGTYLLDWYFVWLLVSAAILMLILCLHAWRQDKPRPAPATQADQSILDELAKSKDAYDQFCRAMHSVVYEGYKVATSDAAPPLAFKSIECEFEVDADGNAKVKQTYEVITGEAEARFWNLKLDRDQYAIPFDTLDTIKFHATTDEPDFKVAATPLDNKGIRRSVAIWFIPKISKNSSRKIIVTFEWPGWFGELVATGVTNWLWSYGSIPTKETSRVNFKFTFASALGQIDCNILSKRLGTEDLVMNSTANENVWTYEDAARPANELTWDLRFELRR